jgi:hypothetical protein
MDWSNLFAQPPALLLGDEEEDEGEAIDEGEQEEEGEEEGEQEDEEEGGSEGDAPPVQMPEAIPALELHIQPDAVGTDVVAQLTGLTSLQVAEDREPSHEWQSQLATALSAMHHLRRLALPQVWPGPVADALSQMRQLTELEIWGYQDQSPAAALVLPSVQIVRVRPAAIDVSFLDSLVAPQLKVLQRGLGTSLYGEPFIETLVLNVYESQTPAQQTEALERCMRGVMRCCNNLELCFQQQVFAADTQEEVDSCRDALATSVMQVMGRCWRPDPNLVDGSSPLNPLRLAGGHNIHVASLSAGWGLILSDIVVTRSLVAALSPGLTRIDLRCVEVGVGMGVGVAQPTAWGGSCIQPSGGSCDFLVESCAAGLQLGVSSLVGLCPGRHAVTG